MINRRTFLKGLLSAMAVTAIKHNGVWQPQRRVFDMAENTWRERLARRELLFAGEHWRIDIPYDPADMWTADVLTPENVSVGDLCHFRQVIAGGIIEGTGRAESVTRYSGNTASLVQMRGIKPLDEYWSEEWVMLPS